jgi:hypothetical protein
MVGYIPDLLNPNFSRHPRGVKRVRAQFDQERQFSSDKVRGIGVTRGECVHAVEGRLRVRIWELKKSPDVAAQLQKHLDSHAGIHGVETNTTTGSLLIQYDADRLTRQQLLGTLAEAGYPVADRAATPSGRRSSDFTQKIAQELALAGCAALLKYGCRALVTSLA